jgi:hypothetical protein
MLLADRGYDADWIRALVRQHGAWANIPPKRNRTEALCFSPYLYRARNLVERFFNKIKHCRRVATRYDKLAANYLAFVPRSIGGFMLIQSDTVIFSEDQSCCRLLQPATSRTLKCLELFSYCAELVATRLNAPHSTTRLSITHLLPTSEVIASSRLSHASNRSVTHSHKPPQRQ